MFTRTRIFRFSVLLLSMVPVQAQSNTARSEIVFPLLVVTVPATLSSSCECWRTTFEVLNPHPSTITVQLTLFDSSGTIQEAFSDTILANRTKRFFPGDALFGPGTLKTGVTGWVGIAASRPVIARQTITHYQFYPNPAGIPTSVTLSEIVKTPPLQTGREVIQVQYDGSKGTNTGIAITFPAQAGSPAVRAKLILRWVDGRIVAERELTIAPNRQVVAFLTELLPESLNFSTFNLVGGTLEMTFDRDVYVTAIQYTPRRFGVIPETMEEPLAGTVPSAVISP